VKHTPEEIAELLKERPHQPHYIAALVRRAIKEEREACAKLCEPQSAHDDPLTAWRIAEAIRSRGKVKP